MKSIEERNYPYPILLENGGDYVNSSFNVLCKVTLSDDKKYLILQASYELKCPFIEKLLEEGKIGFFIHIEQRTFRKSAVLSNTGTELKIPMNWLSPNNNLEIMPMIIAKKDFKFAYDNSMDKIFSYFNDEFEVKKYQIFGYGNFIQCELPTNSKVGSIFTFSCIKDKDEIAKGNPYIITFEANSIDIKVLPKIYEEVQNSIYNNATFNKLLYSSFVYPAVQMAILNIVKDFDNVKDLKWAIAIRNRLLKEKKVSLNENSDLSIQDIIEYSHIVLGSLIEDAFNDIENGGL